MNLLAVSGSLRAASTNSALTCAAAALVSDAVREWRAQVGAAAGVLFVTPEYAYGIPAA